MSASLIIVETERDLFGFSKKLKSLAEERGVDVLAIYGFEDFKKNKAIGDHDDLQIHRFVYLGSGTPRMEEPKFEEFGCRIFLKGNKCLIYASAGDLPRRDFDDFQGYCMEMKVDYPDDVIVPLKKREVSEAQYTVLIYEFADNWLNPFMQGVADDITGVDDDAAETLDETIGKTNKVIAASATSAAAVCAVPIPLADAVMLVAVQTAMMAAIARIFKINIKKGGLKALVFAVLGAGGAVQIGRMAVGSLLKFIPAKGSIVGGIVSATTASAITFGMGKAFMEICKSVKAGDLSPDDITSKKGKDRFRTHFKGYFTKNKNES